jgi:diguanylate cyclase (GGDEF)-like protein
MNILDDLAGRIKKCSEEVDNRNRNHLILFSQGALLLTAIMICMSLALPYYHWMLVPHAALFVYSIVLFFLAKYCQRNKIKQIRAILYLLFAPLMAGGVLVSSALDPTRPGVTVIIFICIIPLFIIDNPWRVIGYQLAFAGFFVACAYYFKPYKVFVDDMFYFPVYMAYIIGVNIFALMEKVSGVENYLLARKAAEHDNLTELYNRASGETRISQLLQQNIPGTFAILDIDDFKLFNDNYGHQAGDAVLCALSKAMHSVFRSSDILWRFGGDEFAVYAVDMTDPVLCRQRFDKLMQMLNKIDLPQVSSVHVGISVGCTICMGKQLEFSKLYKSSDDALYESKNNGKGQLTIKNI